MEEILKRLVPRGRMILVVYYGHEGGEKELDMVQDYCQSLPQEKVQCPKIPIHQSKTTHRFCIALKKKGCEKPVQLR